MGGIKFKNKIPIDITNPLRRGIWIDPGEGHDSLWIKKGMRDCLISATNRRIGHVAKDCTHLAREKDRDWEPFQYDSWLRHQGTNQRRRRKNSPLRNEKEESPLNSSPYNPLNTSPKSSPINSLILISKKVLSLSKGICKEANSSPYNTLFYLNLGPLGSKEDLGP